tara:strand:- start:46 stop:597 length:552 start_codon:yes stop_codon:yes gene_type:complete
MAHFAILSDDNTVSNVITVDNNKLLDDDGNEVEQKGIDLLKTTFQDENLKAVQCSIWTRNGERVEMNLHKPPFRNNYPCVGATWDPVKEIFIMPQSYPSWVLDANSNWYPPVTKPTEEQCYYGGEASPPAVNDDDYITIDNVVILPDRINPLWNESETRWQGMHNDSIVRVWDPDTSSWTPSL